LKEELRGERIKRCSWEEDLVGISSWGEGKRENELNWLGGEILGWENSPERKKGRPGGRCKRYREFEGEEGQTRTRDG